MGNAAVRRNQEAMRKQEIARNQQIKKNQITELNSISRSLQGKAGDYEKGVKAEKLKMRRAMERRNMAEARTYAETAVRKRDERISYLHLSARLDDVAARLDVPFQLGASVGRIATFLKSLESSLAAGDLHKLCETVDQFESEFVFAVTGHCYARMSSSQESDQSLMVAKDDNSTLQTRVALAAELGLLTPEKVADEINLLMKEVADECGLEVSSEQEQEQPQPPVDEVLRVQTQI